jgi:hypothetical protein
MTEHISDPVFIVIEKHRSADAAWDDSLDRCADEPVKDERHEQERAALVALLRTRPETLAGALAVLRYMADYASMFHGWSNPLGSAGAAFLPMIADAIEAATR